jgi:hypothetical protein
MNLRSKSDKSFVVWCGVDYPVWMPHWVHGLFWSGRSSILYLYSMYVVCRWGPGSCHHVLTYILETNTRTLPYVVQYGQKAARQQQRSLIFEFHSQLLVSFAVGELHRSFIRTNPLPLPDSFSNFFIYPISPKRSKISKWLRTNTKNSSTMMKRRRKRP